MRMMCLKCLLSRGVAGLTAASGFQYSAAGIASQRYASSQPDADSALPVIRVPRALQKKVEGLRQSKGPAQWKGRLFTARPGTELISSRRKELNHYMNETYQKFTAPRLASHGWKHSRARGDHFTILAYRGNPSIAKNENGGDKDKTERTFEDLKLSPSVISGLQMLDIDTPTSIQLAAIPAIVQGKHTLCAAETGSGKTLAYLLPLMHRLLSESKLVGQAAERRLPRSLVLVPVGELAAQVKEVAEVLCRVAGLTVAYLDGDTTLKNLEKTLDAAIDIVISTPGPMLNSVRQGFASLGSVSHVVVDESDTMLDDSFAHQTLNILQQCNIGPGTPCRVTPAGEAQLTLVGATMPRKATTILSDVIKPENLEIISTSHLHRIMPHIPQKFIRLHSQDKALNIVEILKKASKGRISTMVFCNTTTTCDWLAYFLSENGIPALRLHSKMGAKSRHGVLKAFQSGEASVLVCTDVVSRGVDTVQVQLVVNFDFPLVISDYIHRTGRVGRVGSQGSGHVTSFVVHKWDVDLVNKIERAVRMREALPKVDANIKGKHSRRLLQEELQDVTQTLKG